MIATLYGDEDLKDQIIDIKDISDEDQVWFEDNNVSVALKRLGETQFALYGDVGLFEDDNVTPLEIKITAKTIETCRDALHRLRIECEKVIM